MVTSTGLVRSFGHIAENNVPLGKSITETICERINILLASFQALYLQYSKHHFIVNGSEFYSLHNGYLDAEQPIIQILRSQINRS